MTNRRSLLAGAATGGIALMAGCLEDILGDLLDGDIEATAEQAGIDPAALDAAGFEHLETDDFGIDETFTIGDESIHLSATSWVNLYGIETLDPDDFDEGTNPEDLDHLSEADVVAVAVLSTPSAEFAGSEVNPAGHLDDDELIEQFNDELVDGHVETVTRVDTLVVEVLGEETELSVFEASFVDESTDEHLPVYLYLTTVASGDDYVVPLGVHHQAVDAQDTIVDLITAVVHPIDES